MVEMRHSSYTKLMFTKFDTTIKQFAKILHKHLKLE